MLQLVILLYSAKDHDIADGRIRYKVNHMFLLPSCTGMNSLTLLSKPEQGL
jgi:hypothetical protein